MTHLCWPKTLVYFLQIFKQFFFFFFLSFFLSFRKVGIFFFISINFFFFFFFLQNMTSFVALFYKMSVSIFSFRTRYEEQNVCKHPFAKKWNYWTLKTCLNELLFMSFFTKTDGKWWVFPCKSATEIYWAIYLSWPPFLFFFFFFFFCFFFFFFFLI